MSHRSPPPLQSIYSNRSNIYATSTIAQQIMFNITQSIVSLETNNNNNSQSDDDNTGLNRYRLVYRNYHGIISSFVCIFGLTCNLFNIIVLTRPLMRSSTNTILTSLALSDLIKMLFVLPAVIIFYCLPTNELKSEPDPTSQFQVTFYMIQMLVTLTLHCISTWLTVFLAAFRYVFLSCKSLTVYVSSPDRSLIGVSIVVIISIILCIPSFVEHRIVKIYVNDTYSSINKSKLVTVYRFEETAFSKSLSIRETVFVLHSVMFKLIPCVFLLLFSFLLIQQLRNALKKSEILQRHSSRMTSSMNTGRIRGRRRENENRRTTLMLVIVCVLFLVTELPQGAILLLTFLSKNNSKYYYQIYQHLGDTFDILALINNSVNFILYCLMSRAFRDTFKQTFCFCQKIDQHQSSVSFAAMKKHRDKHANQSNAFETVVTYKCPDDYQTNVPNNSIKKKKRTSIALRIFNGSKPISSS